MLGRGQCPSAGGEAFVSFTQSGSFGREDGDGGGSLLTDQTRLHPATPPICCSPVGDGSIPSAFFSLPGHLFQPEVTLCHPGTPLPPGTTAPTTLGMCSWVPSPVSVTPPPPPAVTTLSPRQGIHAAVPPCQLSAVASHFPFLSPGQSHCGHPSAWGPG